MALHRSISMGDVQACERALRAGANASEQLLMPPSPDPLQDDGSLQFVADPRGCPTSDPVEVLGTQFELPVHHAAGKGQINILHLLVLHGADPKASDRWGGNALHAAAAYNQLQMLGELLRLGLDVNAVDANGHTPLLAAAEAGAEEAVIVLMDAGAGVHGCTASGRTALHLLCDHGCLDAASRLLKAGARVAQGDLGRRTALHVAAGFQGPGGADLCALLCEHGNASRPRLRDDSALRSPAKLTMALKAPAAPPLIDFQDDAGCTALHLAAARGLAANCAVLLNKGADPWAKNGVRLSALDIAVAAEQPQAVSVIQAYCDASRADACVNALLQEMGL